jgi:hypothetical protein
MTISRKPQSPEQAQSSVNVATTVLAWGKDRSTGVGRHITEVKRGLACNCICESCGHRLEAVNPQKRVFRRGEKRPFFRHYRGQEKGRCLILASRLALQRALLAEQGVFELPARRIHMALNGASGATYIGTAENPAETVFVRDVRLTDEALAVLVLEGGREIQVLAKGTFRSSPEGDAPGLAVVELDCDAAEIASMSTDEIRSRLFLRPDGLTWRCAPSDKVLGDVALSDAQRQADEWLDAVADGDRALPKEWQRESALHRAVKEIIAEYKQMSLPEQRVVVTRKQSGIEKTREWHEEPKQVTFDSVSLEVRLGRVIPDVVARVGEHELLIEVTVTHSISEVKEDIFHSLGQPVLEIDLSRSCGRVDRKELRRIVLDRVELKRWVYHPRIKRRHDELLAQVLEDVAEEQLARQVRLSEQLKSARVPPAGDKGGERSDAWRPTRKPLSPVNQHAVATGRDSLRHVPTQDAGADPHAELARLMLRGRELEAWKRKNPGAWEAFRQSDAYKRIQEQAKQRSTPIRAEDEN